MDQRYFLKSRLAKKTRTQALTWNPFFLFPALRMEPPMPDMRRTGSGSGSKGSKSWIRLRRKQGKRRQSVSIFDGKEEVRVGSATMVED